MSRNCPDCGKFLAKSDPHEPGDYVCVHGCGAFIRCRECDDIDEIDPDEPPADGLCGSCHREPSRAAAA